MMTIIINENGNSKKYSISEALANDLFSDYYGDDFNKLKAKHESLSKSFGNLLELLVDKQIIEISDVKSMIRSAMCVEDADIEIE